MNKFILLGAALLIAGTASWTAQAKDGHSAASKHRRIMSSHARYEGSDPGMVYRGFGIGPGSYGYRAPYGYSAPYGYGGGSYGGDDNAEGRTSGG